MAPTTLNSWLRFRATSNKLYYLTQPKGLRAQPAPRLSELKK